MQGITEDLKGPGYMVPIQRYLSKAQALPVIGPILISPIKAGC